MGLTRWCAGPLSHLVAPSPIALDGTWGSGFKPSWYMTSSDVANDPQRLVRVWILVSHMYYLWLTFFSPLRAHMNPNSTHLT